DLVGAIARLYRANGVKVDLEMALFDADHHPGAPAVRAARRALADRPSVLGHDVLAWNLYRAGKADEAWKEIQKALTLGGRDPQLQFHAATVAFATGHPARQRSTCSRCSAPTAASPRCTSAKSTNWNLACDNDRHERQTR